MKRLLLVLCLTGCGILTPEDRPTVDVWWTPSEIGVTFYAVSQPKDTVFWTMEWLYQGYWSTQHGMDANGEAIAGLAWTAPINVIAKFKAWGPEARADSVWYGHEIGP